MSAEHRRWAESASKTRKDGVHVGSCSLAEQSYMDGILNERFCIGPKNVPEPYADDPEVGPLFFPANVYPPEHMCPGVEVNLRNLYGALEGASSHVLSEVARSLGLAPSHFKPLLKYHSSNLQVANYPSQYEEAPESPIRVKAHADSGTITLLIRQQSTESTDCAGGLEILLDGNWQRVGPLPPGCMLVNLGHIMSFLSGGVYRSTKHRVTNPNPASSTGTPNRRISIAYFQKPDPNGLLIPVHGPSRATQTKNLTRVGIMHKFKHLGQAEASRRYHEIIGSPYLLE
jgi:isopenicillin N synthase-like dioxygenase